MKMRIKLNKSGPGTMAKMPQSIPALIGCALLLGALAGCSRADGTGKPDAFVLGFLPSQRASEIVPNAEAVGAFLSERMGIRVAVQVPTRYEPLVEGLRFGHIQAAFLDGGPAWIAHKRSGAEVILAEINRGGNTYYWAEAFTGVDSDIEELSDVLGKRIAFTSRTGSSGFLMPIGSMIAEGLLVPQGSTLVDLENALQEGFASTVDAGGYQQALNALLEGRVDVALGAHDAPERFLSETERTGIRSFHRFGRIPSHAVLVAQSLSDELVERFRAAMLELNEPENIHLLQAVYGVEGFRVTGTEAHLGEFGRAISALPGMQRTLLAKRNR